MKTKYIISAGALISMIPGTMSRAENNSKIQERPNILFIVSEDNGREIGCYGAPVKTPNLDRLAQEGTLFENAYVPQAGSSPSRACFLTGLYPHQNGQVGLATWKYSMYNPETPNLINSLKAAGYRTGMVGKLHVNPENAFDLDYHKINKSNFKREHLENYAEFAMEFINASEDPFYLQVNYPDAHDPYLRQVNGLPENPLSGEDIETIPFVGLSSPELLDLIANYYNCIMRLDSLVGDLIEQLKQSGKYENTLIVYIGDHGAHLIRGKISCYEGGTCIPLLISWPGKGLHDNRYEGLVSTLDLYPTFMDAANIEIPDYLPGKSLKEIVTKGSQKPLRKYLFTEFNVHSNHNPFPQRTIRDKRFKLIWSPLAPQENPAFKYNVQYITTDEKFEEMLATAPEEIKKAYRSMTIPDEFELYDLENDPYEWNNLADNPEYARILSRMKKELKKWQERTSDPFIDKEVARRFFNDVMKTEIKKVHIPYRDYMDPEMDF